MSYKLVFVLNAVVAVVLGLALAFAPVPVMKQFGMDTQVTEAFVARLLGAALASVGLLLWFAKDAEEAAQKNLSMAALAGTVLGLIVTLIGVAPGVIRNNGWIALIVEVVFGLGYAFLLFLKPKMK